MIEAPRLVRCGTACAQKRMRSGRKRQAPRGNQGREGGWADCVTTRPEGRMAIQVKTRVKAGGLHLSNHTETLVRAKGQGQSLTVKTHVKAGGINLPNHTETLVRAMPRQRTRV